MTTGYITQFSVVHVVNCDLLFSKWTADAQQIKIGTIPAGSLVKGSSVNVSTAFSPTSLSVALIEVGTVANPSLFLAGLSADAFSIGFNPITTGRGLLTTDTDVYIKLSKNTMAAFPTTGRVQFDLEYFPPNANKDKRSTFDT